jgi:hypothetical protein
MLNCKGVIEKIWWVIPPVVIVLGIPLVYTFKEMMEFSQPMNLFIWCYGKNLFVHIRNFTVLSGIVAISTFGFMRLGYYLSRKKEASLRILSPIIIALLGYFISQVIALLIIGVA